MSETFVCPGCGRRHQVAADAWTAPLSCDCGRVSVPVEFDVTLVAGAPRTLDVASATAASPSGGPPSLGADYDVRGVVGHGGMGQVLLVHDARLQRDVVLKQLLDQRTGDPQLARRFLVEARVTGQLEHPNIVPVHELGWADDGSPYFTMKHVSGQTLTRIIGGLLPDSPIAPRLQHFRAVCHGVAFAHDRGVIHRDLKPDNIMVGEFGEVLVMDWGLAKRVGEAEDRPGGTPLEAAGDADGETAGLTHQGAIMGTPRYMPPEQARGEIDRLGPAADIYALGAILYELLTLRPAFSASTLHVLLLRVIDGQFVPPGEGEEHAPVPPELAAIVCKAMAADPDQRYASVLAMLADIDAYLAGYSVSVHRDSLGRRLGKWVRRNKAVAVALIATSLSVGGLVGAQQLDRHRRLTAELTAIEALLTGVPVADDTRLYEGLTGLDQLLERVPGQPRATALKAHVLEALCGRLEDRWRRVAARPDLSSGATPAEREAWFMAHSQIMTQGRLLLQRGGPTARVHPMLAGVSYRLARRLVSEGSVGMAQVLLTDAEGYGYNAERLRLERDRIRTAPARQKQRAESLLQAVGVVRRFPGPASDRALVELLQLRSAEVVRVLMRTVARAHDTGRHWLICEALRQFGDTSTRTELGNIPRRPLRGGEPAPRALASRLLDHARGRWPTHSDPKAARAQRLSLTVPECFELRLLFEMAIGAPELGTTDHRLPPDHSVRHLRELRLLIALAPERAGAVAAALAWRYRPHSRPWTIATELARHHRLTVPAALLESLPPRDQAMILLALGEHAKALAIARRLPKAEGLRALALEAAGRPDRALALLDEALRAGDQRAWLVVGRALLVARDPARTDVAIEGLALAGRLAPIWTVPRWRALRLLRVRGQLQAAQAVRDREAHDTFGAMLAERARLAIQLGQVGRATRMLDELRARGTDSALYQETLAEVLGELGGIYDAYRAAEYASRLRPRSRAPLRICERFFDELGVIATKGLMVRVDELARADPRDHEARYWLARLWLRLSEVDSEAYGGGASSTKFYQHARLSLEAALAIRSTPRYRKLHARILFYYAKYDRAIAALAGMDDDPEALRLRARAHRGRGDGTSSATDLLRALELRPDDAALHAALGDLLVVAGRPADAARHLDRAVALGTDDPQVHANRATLLLARNDAAGARAELKRALALETHVGMKGLLLERLIPLLTQGADARETLHALDRILQTQPILDNYRWLRARLHAQMGHVELGIADVRYLMASQKHNKPLMVELRKMLAALEARRR